ncbi:MAG: sensor histidine kinase [Thermoplasmatota archaeon]
MAETATAGALAGQSPPSAFARIRQWLPEGRGLPAEEWQLRHRAVQVFILGHAVGLPLFGMARGSPAGLALAEGALIGLIGLMAGLTQLSRKLRSGLAALGCVLSSAVLVQFWGGIIEAHFHFFVVVALISLYQDWLPFLLAIGFVAIDHGLVGTLVPVWVYNHADAIESPWSWAVIHAGFILAESVALVAVWRANEQARAATDRVLRSTGDGMLGVDAECNITFANPAAVAMGGGHEKALLGKPLYMLLLGDDGRPLFAGPDILRQNPGAFSLEAHLARGSGTPLPIEVLCTPIEGHGHAEGAVVAMRDLTERLRAEKEREVATVERQELDQLREVNTFKARFMNMAAHELNTPLTPINVQLATLKRRATTQPLDEKHINSIQLLDRNFRRLTDLVHDLLDSTRLQTDRLPLRPEPFDMAAIGKEVVDSFRPAFQEAGVALDLQAPVMLACRGDASRIAQAVSNLLGNALKFTPRGGSVAVTVSEGNGKATVAVRDTGLGMNEAQIARLFRPFEQVHEGVVLTKGGSGLGLYIARGIIELHGGFIQCKSDGPGTGTTFTFEIPVEGPPEDTSPAVPEPERKEPPIFSKPPSVGKLKPGGPVAPQ